MSLGKFRPVDYEAAVVPEDDMPATKFIATALLIRALRGAGLHHALVGAACTVAIVGVDASAGHIVADAARDLLKRAAPGRPGYRTAVHDHTSPTKRSAWSLDGLVESLQDGTRLCCIYDAADAVPDALALLADGIAVFPEADARLIAAASLRTLGRLPSAFELEALAGLPLSLLAVAINPDRSIAQGTTLARRVTAARLIEEQAEEAATLQDDAPADGPTLADLHGLGEAGDWGRSLAADIADYRAGVIGWSEVDRGALVSGPPGTGKTTFALALGRSCGMPVHVHSFARWQASGHLNDLLKAMRKAFSDAVEAAPCILFVDEVDAVGDRAKFSDHNANYQTQVVNGFLECLDGAESRAGVVVVGATNHAEMIDAAVRRSGRLDRDVRIPLPDHAARVGILGFHLKGSLTGADVDSVASRMEGSSGADLERVVRDAKRHARRARRTITAADLEAAAPRGEFMSDALHRRACIHEAGHYVVGWAVSAESGTTPLYASVTREVANGSAGMTQFDRSEGFDRTRDSSMAELCVLLAGGAAEVAILGNRGMGSGGGAGSDLHQATSLATAMVAAYGLGTDLVHRFDPFSGSAEALLACHSATSAAVGALLASANEESQRKINQHREEILAVAERLMVSGRVETALCGLPKGRLKGSSGSHRDRLERLPPAASEGVDLDRAGALGGVADPGRQVGDPPPADSPHASCGALGAPPEPTANACVANSCCKDSHLGAQSAANRGGPGRRRESALPPRLVGQGFESEASETPE